LKKLSLLRSWSFRFGSEDFIFRIDFWLRIRPSADSFRSLPADRFTRGCVRVLASLPFVRPGPASSLLRRVLPKGAAGCDFNEIGFLCAAVFPKSSPGARCRGALGSLPQARRRAAFLFAVLVYSGARVRGSPSLSLKRAAVRVPAFPRNRRRHQPGLSSANSRVLPRALGASNSRRPGSVFLSQR
jgi:hypothetical protein